MKRRVLILLVAAALVALAVDFVRITVEKRMLGQLEVPLMKQQD